MSWYQYFHTSTFLGIIITHSRRLLLSPLSEVPLALSPGHSYVFNVGCTQKTWEWPGDEAKVPLYSRCIILNYVGGEYWGQACRVHTLRGRSGSMSVGAPHAHWHRYYWSKEVKVRIITILNRPITWCGGWVVGVLELEYPMALNQLSFL